MQLIFFLSILNMFSRVGILGSVLLDISTSKSSIALFKIRSYYAAALREAELLLCAIHSWLKGTTFCVAQTSMLTSSRFINFLFTVFVSNTVFIYGSLIYWWVYYYVMAILNTFFKLLFQCKTKSLIFCRPYYIFGVNQLDQQSIMQKTVTFTDYEGIICFDWDPSIFDAICRQMGLETKVDENGNSRYTRYYPIPFLCSVEFFLDGKVKISGARSYDLMQFLFANEVVKVLINRLPKQIITVTEELAVTKYTAIIALKHPINIKQIQKGVKELFKMDFHGESVQLPHAVHGIDGVTIVLYEKQVKVFEAQLVERLETLKTYLSCLLKEYRIQGSSLQKKSSKQLAIIDSKSVVGQYASQVEKEHVKHQNEETEIA